MWSWLSVDFIWSFATLKSTPTPLKVIPYKNINFLRYLSIHFATIYYIVLLLFVLLTINFLQILDIGKSYYVKYMKKTRINKNCYYFFIFVTICLILPLIKRFRCCFFLVTCFLCFYLFDYYWTKICYVSFISWMYFF